jgi:Asp-tRNA(Asn)/Glu-tRNA(Gln) amidotransferase A subunit family amidase
MQFIGKAWDEVKLLQASMLLKSENPPRFPSV